MTNETMKDGERAAFEAWYTQHYTSHIPRRGDDYYNLDAQLAWRTWLAARAATEVERGEGQS